MMENQTTADVFEVTWNEKQYPCKRVSIGDSVVFVIEFTQRPLYLSKGIDINGEAFWVSIPPDTKLTRVVREIGEQIDKHYK